jgi:hypothetical protein
MRDFRDAKAMAHSLREALAAKDLKVTNSESLELISKALGLPDWNTLSAAIGSAAPEPGLDKPPSGKSPVALGGVQCSKELADTLSRAKSDASGRGHYFLTLEHVLLALIDDPQGSATLKACAVDPEALRASLQAYVEDGLRKLSDAEWLRSRVPNFDPKAAGRPEPTAGLHRAVQVAAHRAALSRRPYVTASDVLIATFLNAGDARSAVLLEEHGMTRRAALEVLGTPTGN